MNKKFVLFVLFLWFCSPCYTQSYLCFNFRALSVFNQYQKLQIAPVENEKSVYVPGIGGAFSLGYLNKEKWWFYIEGGYNLQFYTVRIKEKILNTYPFKNIVLKTPIGHFNFQFGYKVGKKKLTFMPFIGIQLDINANQNSIKYPITGTDNYQNYNLEYEIYLVQGEKANGSILSGFYLDYSFSKRFSFYASCGFSWSFFRRSTSYDVFFDIKNGVEDYLGFDNVSFPTNAIQLSVGIQAYLPIRRKRH